MIRPAHKFVLSFGFILVASVGAEEPLPVHVVLFTPDGVEAPADAADKIRSAAEYAESFLVQWMRHWGYPPAREQFFSRKDDRIQVLRVAGSKPPGEYDPALDLMKELWPLAHEQYGLPRNNPIWWVWVYKGDPPVRFGNYRGSGDVRRGGYGVVNYENRPGVIRPDADMAAGFLHDFTLKGCIHELGHAFGIFHIGPLRSDGLGNTLMGPRTDPFRAAVRSESQHEKVYLSPAAAAMLWKHPVFSGTQEERSLLPSVDVSDFAADYDVQEREVIITGTLNSDHPAHTVILIDEAEPRQSDYWRKTYVDRLDPDGRFRIRVTEPTDGPGTYRLMFCFENGSVTGDGKSRNLDDAPALLYKRVGRRYLFRE